MDKESIKHGIERSIEICLHEADIADLIFDNDERAAKIYKLACANMVVMLRDEIEIIIGD